LRAYDLVAALARAYPRLARPGQLEVLGLTAEWFQPTAGQPAPCEGLARACARLLADSTESRDGEVQAAALELCAALGDRFQAAEILSPARELARSGLQAGTPAVRLRAIQLSLRPGMDLIEQVTALLSDPSAEVRRAAVLAIGPADKVVLDDTLLPSLH